MNVFDSSTRPRQRAAAPPPLLEIEESGVVSLGAFLGMDSPVCARCGRAVDPDQPDEHFIVANHAACA